MENIKHQIDDAYSKATVHLENYSEKSNTVTGMIKYLKVLTDAVGEFAKLTEDIYAGVHEDFKVKTKDYIRETHSKIVATYKPK